MTHLTTPNHQFQRVNCTKQGTTVANPRDDRNHQFHRAMCIGKFIEFSARTSKNLQPLPHFMDIQSQKCDRGFIFCKFKPKGAIKNAPPNRQFQGVKHKGNTRGNDDANFPNVPKTQCFFTNSRAKHHAALGGMRSGGFRIAPEWFQNGSRMTQAGALVKWSILT